MSIVGNTPGSADFIAVAELLANPAKLKAEHERLESVRKQAEEVIALVGPAQDVLRLREEAKKDREEAARLLGEARTEAYVTLKDAQERSNRIAKESQAEAHRVKETIQSLLEEAERRYKDAEEDRARAARESITTKAGLETALKTAEDERLKAEALGEEARVLLEKLEAERSRVQKLVAEFASALRGHH